MRLGGSSTGAYIYNSSGLLSLDAVLEGNVEMCWRGSWRAVCDQGWNIINAAVVCRQLGYPFEGEKVRKLYNNVMAIQCNLINT